MPATDNHAIDNAEATGYDWFKSSYSSGNNNCVETARIPNIVPVRDSKDPQGPALTFSPDAWSAFIGSVKRGELPSV